MEVKQKKQFDYLFMILSLMLIGFGFLMVYSRTLSVALLRKQIYLSVFSLLISFLLFFTDSIEFMKKNWKFIIWSSIVLLVIPLIFRKVFMVNNSYRWIKIGFFSIQPSEIVKLALVLYLSVYFSNKKSRIFSFYEDLVIPSVICFIMMGIIYLQKDLSTVVLLFTFLLFSFYLSQVPLLYIFYLFSFALSVFVLSALSKQYRMQRLLAYFVPFRYPSDIGFQVIQSYKAISGGGFFGNGIGSNIFRQTNLPLSYSDYIFSAVAEDFGLFGIFFLILLYALWGLKAFQIASKMKSRFNFLFITFITIMVLIQVLINISVASGLIPPTGLPLPFISYGGTSLLINTIFATLILKLDYNAEKDNADEI